MVRKVKQKTTEKAITLIALTITIIVLLILAGITIATLTGENGILTKAKEAKKRTEEATAEEIIKLEVAGSLGEDGKIDQYLLNENLRKNIEGLTYNGKPITEVGSTDENRITSLPATVALNWYYIRINENGNVDIENFVNVSFDTVETGFVYSVVTPNGTSWDGGNSYIKNVKEGEVYRINTTVMKNDKYYAVLFYNDSTLSNDYGIVQGNISDYTILTDYEFTVPAGINKIIVSTLKSVIPSIKKKMMIVQVLL